MLVLMLLGYVVLFALTIWLSVDAYKNAGILHVFLIWLLPLYSLYWLFFRMKDRGSAIAMFFAGGLLMISPVFFLKAQTTNSLATPVALNREVCNLLTPDQVGAELKEAYDPGETATEDGSPACNYRNSATFTHKFTVTVTPCTEAKLSALPLGQNDHPVMDIGDQALVSNGILIARKGTSCYSMSLSGLPNDATLEGRKNLMRTVMAR